jgi:hypothetical protein
MFPAIAEPRPYEIFDNAAAILRLKNGRQRASSQLTLVSVRISRDEPLAGPSSSQLHIDTIESDDSLKNGRTRRDDCDDWQLVHRRVSVRDLLGKFNRPLRRRTLPMDSVVPKHAGSATMLKDRLRRLGQRTLSARKYGSDMDISLRFSKGETEVSNQKLPHD